MISFIISTLEGPPKSSLLLHKRNTNNLLHLKCKNFHAQISISFKCPVGHYANYSRASKRTVIAFLLHVPMLKLPEYLFVYDLKLTRAWHVYSMNRISNLQRNMIFSLWANQRGKPSPQSKCCF